MLGCRDTDQRPVAHPAVLFHCWPRRIPQAPAAAVVDEDVPGRGTGPPPLGRRIEQQPDQRRRGQHAVDERDPALGPQHRVIERCARTGLAGGEREHGRRGQCGPDDAGWAVAGVEACEGDLA